MAKYTKNAKVITKWCLNWILLLPYKYLQTRKLICKRFDLVDMVQHIVAFLYLAHEELMMNKDDVGQTLRLVMLQRVFHASSSPLQLLMCAS
jgi:hypothetical protein